MEGTGQPGAFAVGWNHRWTWRAALGSAACALLGAYLAYEVLFQSFGDLSASGRVIIGLMFAAFGLLLGMAAITYLRAGRDRAPVLVVDENGVFDRRITRAPIPWADIQTVTPVLHNRHWMIVINAAEPEGYPFPRGVLWRLNRFSAHMTGAPQLAVKVNALACEAPDLLAKILAAAPPKPTDSQ